MWGCSFYNGTGFGHWFYGGGIMGFPIAVFIIIIVAALIFKLLKPFRSEKSETLDKKDSFEILKIRLAKGEINNREFEKMREMLRL